MPKRQADKYDDTVLFIGALSTDTRRDSRSIRLHHDLNVSKICQSGVVSASYGGKGKLSGRVDLLSRLRMR